MNAIIPQLKEAKDAAIPLHQRVCPGLMDPSAASISAQDQAILDECHDYTQAVCANRKDALSLRCDLLLGRIGPDDAARVVESALTDGRMTDSQACHDATSLRASMMRTSLDAQAIMRARNAGNANALVGGELIRSQDYAARIADKLSAVRTYQRAYQATIGRCQHVAQGAAKPGDATQATRAGFSSIRP